MTIVYYTLLATYLLILVYITLYCLMQFQLLYHYRRQSASPAAGSDSNESHEVPFVTVQLPIYNEQYVVERLIDSVCAFDYPKDRFEIHILDDSTDETVDIVAKHIQSYQQAGFNIEQIRRKDRRGYKAGALKDAMDKARGEFMAIFDADFTPNPDFLKTTIPYFQDPNVGVVQTRWEHINKNYSLITELQALQLNVHFTIEQKGRSAANFMLQFNGTAGVWRKSTIAEAGGWHDDTLTEDLDLSIRAQLKGWKIRYLEEVGSPAELPAEMNGLKSQQFRWMKGGAETARKMLPVIWKSDLPKGAKIHGTLHLLASTVFVFVFALGVLSVPLLIALQSLGFDGSMFSFFIIGTLSIICVYFAANVRNQHTSPHDGSLGRQIVKFVFMFPIFLAMSMGLSLHNSVAVIQGWLGKKSAFVRTPKFNIKGLQDSFRKRAYFSGRLSWTTIAEGVMSLYFAAGIFLGVYIEDTSLILFHGLLAAGYGAIFYFSIKHLSIK
ncbi:MAG: glycosyltransferase family 2 protein [Saprospiraceae bacterium]|nr:glycosyltransferase family 2 protein [Saprospiraceae bacterium]